jgi:hypothetical protein
MLFFPERLSNHCQGLHRTFPEICTTFSAVLLSDPSQNRIRPNTPIQIKGRKQISTTAQLPEILYADSHNCCTDGSTSTTTVTDTRGLYFEMFL